jgi:hypothetical protein
VRMPGCQAAAQAAQRTRLAHTTEVIEPAFGFVFGFGS